MKHNPWAFRAALGVAVLTFVMISAGGMVTSMDAGDAVPDWPLSYNSLMPVQQIQTVAGVIYEHGHRVVGWVLGILTITLAVTLFRSDTRRWMRRLGIVALVLVCLQGGLGGLRVLVVSNESVQKALLSSPTPEAVHGMRITLAVIHTGFGQALLGLMCVIAAASSRSWIADGGQEATAGAMRVRRVGLVTIAILFVQILLGAVRRHTNGTIALHMTGAFVASAAVLYLYIRVLLSCPKVRALVRPANLLLLGIGIQLMLGFFSWGLTNTAIASGKALPDLMGSELLASIILTAHLAIGAALLAGCVILTARAYRFLAPTPELRDAAIAAKGQVAPA